ncbi:BQ5605_C019g08876 [Microbotryum silenes-dioicae]|uniref:BQ5605_C019g08876 protein n=1 Tax=Microbotryum silenes-dioicae TaxID=796604 RepID=A0A2X0LZZ2_9BASI|nr:BQ5605_C019g08876 [Microbotryum silenes-dioicae]
MPNLDGSQASAAHTSKRETVRRCKSVDELAARSCVRRRGQRLVERSRRAAPASTCLHQPASLQ